MTYEVTGTSYYAKLTSKCKKVHSRQNLVNTYLKADTFAVGCLTG